jgi:hypothetical protein
MTDESFIAIKPLKYYHNFNSVLPNNVAEISEKKIGFSKMSNLLIRLQLENPLVILNLVNIYS